LRPTATFPYPVQIPTLVSRRVTGSINLTARESRNVSGSQQYLADFLECCGFEGRFLFFQAAVNAFFTIRSSGRFEKLGMRGQCASHMCVAAAARRTHIHLAHIKHGLRAPNDAGKRLILFSRRSSFCRECMLTFMIFHLSSLLQ
jgi:hypothetical protein